MKETQHSHIQPTYPSSNITYKSQHISTNFARQSPDVCWPFWTNFWPKKMQVLALKEKPGGAIRPYVAAVPSDGDASWCGCTTAAAAATTINVVCKPE